jgi:hypothetical protein
MPPLMPLQKNTHVVLAQKNDEVLTRITAHFPLKGIYNDSAFVGLLPSKRED